MDVRLELTDTKWNPFKKEITNLVYYSQDHIPSVGDEVDFKGLTYKVKSRLFKYSDKGLIYCKVKAERDEEVNLDLI